jgi:hypothetical protein
VPEPPHLLEHPGPQLHASVIERHGNPHISSTLPPHA